MGELLKTWMEQNGPKLQEILLGPAKRNMAEAQPQGNNVNTFPVPDQGDQGDPAPGIGASAFGDQAPVGGDQAFNMSPQQPAQQQPAFQPASQMAAQGGSEPTFEPAPGDGEAATAPDQAMQPRGTSFDDVLKGTSPEQVEAGIKAIETANGGKSIDKIYQDTTGNKGGQLSRQQKGELLMEFGLRLMSASGGVGADFGDAGLGALEAYKGMRKDNITQPARAIEGEQEYRKVESVINKNNRPSGRNSGPQLKQDKDGKWMALDPVNGTAIPIIGIDGNVVEGKENTKNFEKAYLKATYEALHCAGMSGGDLQACQVEALDFATKSNIDVKQRFDLGSDIRRELADPDNPMKHMNSQGQAVKWKALTLDERDQVLRETTDRALGILTDGQVQSQPGSDGPAFGDDGFDREALDLSEEDFNSIPEGKIAVLDDGTRVKKENGQLILVD